MAAERRYLTQGRQRIPLALIENMNDRYATFSKRRVGIYKKASELCILCSVDIGIILFSPTNNPFAFFSPTMTSVIDRYRNPNVVPDEYNRAFDTHSRVRIKELDDDLNDLEEEEESWTERTKNHKEVARTRPKTWYEDVSIEDASVEELREYLDWFENFQFQVNNDWEDNASIVPPHHGPYDPPLSYQINDPGGNGEASTSRRHDNNDP